MNRFNLNNRRRFLLPLASICAAWGGLVGPVLAQSDAGNDGQDPVVNVTEFDTVDLGVQDADLAQVLQMLSLQSRKNIISSRNVSATVSANLYDVTFYEALDAILKVNGYNYREEGNFIYVYTQEEFELLQDAQRQRVPRVFDIDHLSAVDAEAAVTPFLSEGGTISALGAVTSGFQPNISDGGADEWPYSVKLTVFDYPEQIETIAGVLAELDVRPEQVLVEATILQTTVDEADAFGIDFSLIGGLDFANVLNPLAPVVGLLNGSDPQNGFQPTHDAGALQQTNGNTSGPGGFKIGIVSNDISVFLRALDEVTDTTVLARPKVMALNRQRAEVLVGARIGYLSTTATSTTTTQTVEFLDTGIQLVFRPFISKDGTIRMELRPSVSEASLRTVTDSLGAQVTIPDELTNEITTNVRVRDGQTLILGGLFREATSITRRQVPLLGDIPIVGMAFRGQDDSVERQEIIFMITPTITKDEVLWENGEQGMAMIELARIGARSGLLPFGREQMTRAYNQHAIAAYNAGDSELALYHVRNSLRLNGAQAEVIAMRQQLTGDTEKNYERSQLERVINKHNERVYTIDAVRHTNVGEPQKVEPQSNPLIQMEQISDPATEAPEEAEVDNIYFETMESDELFNNGAPEGAEWGEGENSVSYPLDAGIEADNQSIEEDEFFDDFEDFGSFDYIELDDAEESEFPVESDEESDDEFSHAGMGFWNLTWSSEAGGWWFAGRPWPANNAFATEAGIHPNEDAITEVNYSEFE